MLRRFVSLCVTGYISLIVLNWSCTKIDTTNIGGDLIPVVDNINTFADTLDIFTTQGVFNDTTRLTLFENYSLGKISNDPLFGQTDSRLFIQLKPAFYPYYIGLANDTLIGVDSVVLCLAYKGFYGDSTTPIFLTVNEIASQGNDQWDTLSILHPINYAPTTGNVLSAQPTRVYIPDLAKYTVIRRGKDSVQNQIRIKLSNSFAQDLFNSDTTLVGNGNFRTDSFFRAFNNGFAITANSGNALMYCGLNDALTRLEIHYRYKHGAGPDTTVNYFYYNNGSGAPQRGAVANNIVRTRPALPNGRQELYLQTTPGTYANLAIPGLSGYTNRIVHRAEINIEQIPDNPITDSVFRSPNFLYLDLIDSSTTTPKWKPIYYDLNPGAFYDPDYKIPGLPYFPIGGQVDFGYFGGFLRKKADGPVMRSFYQFNVTRYIQQLVTKSSPNYQMRLFAPQSFSYPQYVGAGNSNKIDFFIPYNNSIAFGRVRVGGGEHPNPQYRMRLRVIYSNIK